VCLSLSCFPIRPRWSSSRLLTALSIQSVPQRFRDVLHGQSFTLFRRPSSKLPSSGRTRLSTPSALKHSWKSSLWNVCRRPRSAKIWPPLLLSLLTHDALFVFFHSIICVCLSKSWKMMTRSKQSCHNSSKPFVIFFLWWECIRSSSNHTFLCSLYKKIQICKQPSTSCILP